MITFRAVMAMNSVWSRSARGGLFLATLTSAMGPSRAEATSLEPVPSRSIARTVGLVVLGSGIVVGGVGGALFLYAAPRRLIAGFGCDAGCSGPPLWYVQAGLIGLGAGAALAIAGGIIIYNSPEPAADFATGRARSTGLASIRMVPEANVHWTGLALVGRF
jgi:hypothetical protein